MQCEVKNLADDARSKKTEGTLPPDGFVQQVCQGWVVHEDHALAHKLQEEEIATHYGQNRNVRKGVREDLHHARVVQKEEEDEATTIQMMCERMLLEQEEMDAEYARTLQDLEKNELDKQMHCKEADEAYARIIHEKENQKLEKKKRAKHLIKEIRQVEKIRAQHVSTTEEPTEDQASDRVSTRRSSSPPSSVGNKFVDLTEFCIKPSPNMDKEAIRQLQEEQDAELARLMQEQETKRSGYSDKDRLIAIEAQDRELARVLQEQERARARRLKEKARQKAMQKQMDHSFSEEIEPYASSSPVDHCRDLESTSSRHLTSSLSLEKPSRIARPTDLAISSNTFPGSRESDGSRSSKTIPLERLTKTANLDGSAHSLYDGQDASLRDEPINIAMAIDPTYRKKTLAGPSPSTPSHILHEKHLSGGSTPILPSPTSIPAGTFGTQEHYYDSDEGPAPPYMPIQGQRRNSSLEKKKKGTKDGGCKQQ